MELEGPARQKSKTEAFLVHMQKFSFYKWQLEKEQKEGQIMRLSHRYKSREQKKLQRVSGI